MKTGIPNILLTNAIQQDEQARLAQNGHVVVAPNAQADTLRELVAHADVLVVRAKLPDDIFNHQKRLRGVVRHGVGLDMIPMQHATALKIPVANVPGSNTASVVEYCLNAMFYLQRNMQALALLHPVDDWLPKRARADRALELHGQTLGIVGVGAIGGALAKVALAMGMTVIGLARRPGSLPAGMNPADQQTLFSTADVVVLTCPLTAETRGMVDAPALALMKPEALLINVSRGPVVDTAALVEALQKGRLGGAALDVHDTQPIPQGLYPSGLQRLLLTPHVAGITHSSMARMSRGAVDEVLRLLRGERFVNLVNPQIFQ
ncbi:D-isomer specific 2-hydroxyacid dehydrogenase family protein [Bordetella sp. BOR01]|uniref:NAD(P)-dependent oxidoreductase n=1 Tax=Bordetella sp. BOR01 TaxID=2854779 RepID=UPI001C48831F|nr:NAD(P)-dependent oxidoreductase [Bordetella sp. BOR01]MBV7483355.1 hydroxyacid dehydrogenase [Bordetella sp. BOR01]